MNLRPESRRFLLPDVFVEVTLAVRQSHRAVLPLEHCRHRRRRRHCRHHSSVERAGHAHTTLPHQRDPRK